jgi:predicted tellurium resistance membrane protein TerC
VFGQTFTYNDLIVVAFLIILEGVLSIDNALVLGLLAKRLPEHQRKKALMYGLVGAFVFRLIAIGFAQMLLSIKAVKLIGGGYLLFVAVKYFIQEWRGEPAEKIIIDEDHQPRLVSAETGLPLSDEQEEHELESRTPVPVPERDSIDESAFATRDASNSISPSVRKENGSKMSVAAGMAIKYAKFWPTVFVIELTDIAFAVDSILAAIALVGPPPEGHLGFHPKLWVVVAGGMIGVMLMRVAAAIFISLLERFPRFETAAYLLVTLIGGKLVVDYAFNDTHWGMPHLNFHDYTAGSFWVFWVLMLLCFLTGFLPQKNPKAHAA